MSRLHVGHVGRRGEQVVHERGVEQLPFLAVHELLVERIADAVRHAALDLAFHDHWIDHPAAVVHHDVALDFDLRRLRVYLDHHRMHAVRGAPAVRSEVRRSLETGLAARPHGAAQRIRLERQRPERDATARVAAHVYAPAVEHEIRRRGSELAARQLQHLLAHRDRRSVARAPRHHGAATGEGARAPMELPSVARDHVHVRHVYAQDLGDDLSEYGKVALSLRPHPRRQPHAAARLDGDPRALVRPDPRPLDVAHYADPHVTPRRLEPRLLLPHEARIVDGLERLVQRGLVVAAVVGEGRRVLEQNLVVEGELVRPEQVLTTDLGAVDAELLGREIQEPLDHEHPVLTPGASHRGDDRLVREDRGELAFVARDVVGAEQGALTVDRHGEAVGIVGARVVQEDVLHTEDLAVLRHGELGVVDLAALLRGGEEVLLAILGPLHGAAQPYRRPRDQHLLRVEHHDFRPETAAYERRDHAHL